MPLKPPHAGVRTRTTLDGIISAAKARRGDDLIDHGESVSTATLWEVNLRTIKAGPNFHLTWICLPPSACAFGGRRVTFSSS